MSIFSRPVSEIYDNPPNRIIDVPSLGHHALWGYAFAYETGPSGQDIPVEGNTGLYRIYPKRNTEPVFVLPKEASKFTLTTLSGEGALVSARRGEMPLLSELCDGRHVEIVPETAYFIVNTSAEEDLVIRDVAVPAFQVGDDIEITSSLARPPQKPHSGNSEEVYVAVRTAAGPRNILLPGSFFDILSDVV